MSLRAVLSGMTPEATCGRWAFATRPVALRCARSLKYRAGLGDFLWEKGCKLSQQRLHWSDVRMIFFTCWATWHSREMGLGVQLLQTSPRSRSSVRARISVPLAHRRTPRTRSPAVGTTSVSCPRHLIVDLMRVKTRTITFKMIPPTPRTVLGTEQVLTKLEGGRGWLAEPGHAPKSAPCKPCPLYITSKNLKRDRKYYSVSSCHVRSVWAAFLYVISLISTTVRGPCCGRWHVSWVNT